MDIWSTYRFEWITSFDLLQRMMICRKMENHSEHGFNVKYVSFFKRWSKKRHDCESHMLELVKLYWYSLLFNLRWFIIVLFQHAKACRRWTSQQWRIPRARGRNIPKILALLPCSSKSVPKSYYHEKHQRHLKSRVYNGRSVVQQRKTLQGDYEQYICQ